MAGKRKTCIILNQSAGKARDVDDLMKGMARLPDAEIRFTNKPGSAARFARTAWHNGSELIVAAGGDGTLNEVVNGIGENPGDARVGLIPLGTGNDFARSIGVLPDADAAIDLILAGDTRAVDLVRVTSDEVRYFVNVSSGGFSGLVDEKLTPEMKKTWGPLAYLRSAAAVFSQLRGYMTRVTLDDSDALEIDLYNVIVANGRYVAGGIPVAPEAEIADGLLDVILIPERGKADLVLLAAQILVGKHLTSDAIIFHRAKKAAITSKPGMWFNVDGE